MDSEYSSSSDTDLSTQTSIHIQHPNPAEQNYFEDNEREIDYILVCDVDTLALDRYRDCFSRYISHLEGNGLQFEMSVGTENRELLFIKVHGPYEVLLRYAKAFHLKLAYRLPKRVIKYTHLHCPVFDTELLKADPNGPLFQRAWESVTRAHPVKMTKTERITLVDMMLARARFGYKEGEYGLANLIKNEVINAAYPLHDGQWHWTIEGPLNDRQLLARYWTSLATSWKHQPLDLIQKYYGPDVAFYFAFCGFYNKMLVVASVVGFIIFVVGFVESTYNDTNPIQEICTSDIPMCPVFFYATRVLKFKTLKHQCYYGKLTYMFDNKATILFAFFMGFWGTLFMELWKRKHRLLIYRWHLHSTDDHLAWRKEFEENTHFRRVCPVTGILEPYTPKWITFWNYSITCLTCAFMILIVLLALFIVTMGRLILDPLLQVQGVPLSNLIIGAVMGVLLIKFFGKWYSQISYWLTMRENPRTQMEFDNSYIYKLFLLSFVNNYAGLTYMAFVKGKLYTYPGDMEHPIFMTFVKGDLCHPAGCIMGLCLQLAFIMLFKTLTENIIILFFPYFNKLYRFCLRKEPQASTKLPQWEEDYKLKKMDYHFLVQKYMDIVMQYGFVTFFVAAFPLAPLCALVNNILEIKCYANKFVKYYRRPIPVQIRGLQAWIGIMQAMTFISLATNAFVIGFTSDYVKMKIYEVSVDPSLSGYINSTLSVFATKDFDREELRNMFGANTTCYYRGSRYPPGHPQQYHLRGDYWFEISMRFLVTVVIEHAILALTGLLAYMLPDLPYSIKKQIKYARHERKQQRLKAADSFTRRKRDWTHKKLTLPNY